MARALRIQFAGAFYHITCRGIERRDIYKDDTDRRKFLALLFESLETYQVRLHAYILMNNHFHLLIQTLKANCSEFMRYLNICYTGWFNWRHRRCGNLYQGRYKAFLIDADSYLLTVSRYLHLNPLRDARTRSLGYLEQWHRVLGYRWSSLPGYVNKRAALTMLDYDFTLSIIGDRKAYRVFMINGLKRGIKDPFKQVKNRMILGGTDFVQAMKQYIPHGSLREQPAYRDLTASALSPGELFGILELGKEITEGRLGRRGDGVLRGMVAELLYRYCEITQHQIGGLLGGIDYVSVHQLRRRFGQKMRASSKIRKKYEALAARVKRACTL